MSFENNVFINCPFDNEFRVLLKPLIFIILFADLEPKISSTQSSSNIRINQIKKLIKDSKYSIHDLSRSKPLKKNELPRFNMPYELGLDIGCAEYGSPKLKQKKILILETDPYHYQKVISDIAGQDIESHKDNPEILIEKVRNWFSSVTNNKAIPGASKLWNLYTQFYDDISNELSIDFTEAEIENMSISDFINFSKDWIRKFKTPK